MYVYDQAGSENPAYWTACAPVSTAPFTANCAWNYFLTIEGFNEGLKGLSSTASRVVWMSPEKAYTREGAEEHPLYGDALIFYIEIVDVVDIPCPEPFGMVACDLPT